MNVRTTLACVATFACWASATQAQMSHVSLAIGDRHVTLVATNVTLRQILEEWERVGGVRVVNSDRLTGNPMTLVLRDVTEREALDILLRDTGGFALSARAVPEPGRSAFGTIVVVPAGAPLFTEDRVRPVTRERAVAEDSATASSNPTMVSGQRRRVLPSDPEQTPGIEGAPAATEAAEPAARAEAETPPVQTLLPREQWPPMPSLRPSQAPDARNPFGRAAGSAVPGAIAPTEAGVVYPRVTNPELAQPQNGTSTAK